MTSNQSSVDFSISQNERKIKDGRSNFFSLITGLVLELPSHKNECATKYLSLKGFYVLVEKLTVTSVPHDHDETGPTQEVRYVPLLTSPCDKFKGYEARVAEKRPSPEQPAIKRTSSRGGKKGARLKASRKSVVESISPV